MINPPHLLVVDDEPDVGEFIRDVAAMVGFEARATTDPVEFKTLYRPHIDTLVLDLVMPEIDGIELLRFLGEQHCRANILLTSGFDKRVLQTAKDLGNALGLNIVGYIAKPIRLNELEALLKATRSTAPVVERKRHNLIVENELRQAIQNKEFVLHYQPQIQLDTGKITGVEALVRWRHPTRGLVFPDQFIPLAESTGLIDELTQLVAQEAVEQCDRWHSAGSKLSISINVSAHSLADLTLPDTLAAMTKCCGFDPACLVVEVTESSLMKELTTALDVLARLRVKGIALSLDDFGTGYSTIQQLKSIPFNELKIDKSFLADYKNNESSRVIIHRIIELGHDLGLRTVAEGIETKAAWRFLQQLQCDMGQGYFISRPVPAGEMTKRLQSS